MALPSKSLVSSCLALLELTRSAPHLLYRGVDVYGHVHLLDRWNDASACVDGRHHRDVLIPGFDDYRVHGIWKNAAGGLSGDDGALWSALCFDRGRDFGLGDVFRDLIFRVAVPAPPQATFQNLPKSLCLVSM